MPKSLKIVFLGGLGEIGLNMMALEYRDTVIVIDAGVMFPEDDMPGIDMVIPDISYLRDRKDMLKGLILTHGHEDHIGALPYIAMDLNVPVYGTRFTLALVKHKFCEHNLTGTMPLINVEPRKSINIGPFGVEFVRVSHSVVDGVGLGITTPVGLIVHSGDFKINQVSVQGEITDINKFAEYGERGVLALMSDSTNAEKEGYTISEKEIGKRLRAIFKECPGRVIVAVFASNISRVQQVVNGAESEGRKVVFSGRSMETSVAIARELGYLHVPRDMEIVMGQVKDFPDHEVLIITTGSQGEPMSVLNRMATGTHKHITIKDGDTVILSSKFIPGNERAIAKTINRLYRRGAEVIYEKVSDVHVSGHAFQEELKLMINLTRPRCFIPIHGELRHLVRHARLAEDVGIPRQRILLAENGQVVVLDETGGRIEGSVHAGRVLVDGKGVGDVGKSILRQRRNLSMEGLVIVSVVVDGKDGMVVHGPDIVSHGFVFEDNKSDILQNAKRIIQEILERHGPDEQGRIETIKAATKKALRQYFNLVIQRKPVIFPIIVEV